MLKLEKPRNEKILLYEPGSKEREELKKKLEEVKSKRAEVPLIINGKEVKTDKIIKNVSPHDKRTVLADVYIAGEAEIEDAIEASLDAFSKWSDLEWYHRASVFMKAADLLAGPYRLEAIASIMLNLSKTPYEAEIDLAELVDFWRFNAYYAQEIFSSQPDQFPGELNRFDWRPLEGFILAIPPFNFFSIGGNLPTAPAIVGNVSIWKPSRDVAFANYVIMKALMEAGLPRGVINFLPYDTKYSDKLLLHREFAGLHFTGSYNTLVNLWKKIASNLENYKNFPRIVGETGGKDFLIVHESADIKEAVTGIIRGAFEYQGQKCSALSRLFVARSIWPSLRDEMVKQLSLLKYGDVTDFSVFGGALINESAYRNAVSYIEYAKQHPEEYSFVFGGEYSEEKGWFVYPTVIETNNPRGKLMREEIFAPILTVYVFDDSMYNETLNIIDGATDYGLTGSIFARDREAIAKAEKSLRYTAGNFYINDKPTGAIVGRQPFGGARHSGTNDKAGSWLNLVRWLNPRAIKENLIPPKDWRRPYMG
jgi:1-pyrroline-5-carboxylate dehydrogenase